MTSTEFAPYLWHDNVVHAFRLDLAHPELNHWRSELVLDIDHIVNWRCSADGSAQFLVTPATLTFHDAADLCISIDCGDTGGQVALHDLSIDHIGRTPIEDQKVCFDRPYYRWRIELNWPKDGHISFAASGFSQVLRAAAVPSDTVRLPFAFRAQFPDGGRAPG